MQKHDGDDMGKENSQNYSRSLPRSKCSFPTEISVAWGDKWACKIIDMSEGGIGIITSGHFRRGDKVQIADPEVKACVIWIQDDRVGLKIYH